MGRTHASVVEGTDQDDHGCYAQNDEECGCHECAGVTVHGPKDGGVDGDAKASLMWVDVSKVPEEKPRRCSSALVPA